MLGRSIIFCSFACLLFFSLPAFADVRLKAAAGGDKPLPGYEPLTQSILYLHGSRGETINFLLKLWGKGSDKLKIQKFISVKGGNRVNFPVKFFSLKPLSLTRPSYPGATRGVHFDPLIPFDIDTKVLRINGTQWIWGEINIPHGTGPGDYISRISFGRAYVYFKLEVWKMTIPDKPTLPLYGEISPIDIQLGHYGFYWDYDLSHLDMLLYGRYIKELRAHRAFPMRSYDYAFLSNLTMYKGKQILDVFRYPSLSTSYQSIFIRNLPEGVYYDFATPTYAPDGYFFNMSYLPHYKSYYLAMENSVAALDLPDNTPATFIWDEPFADAWKWKTENQFKYVMDKVRYFGQSVKSWAPSVKVVVTAPCFSELYGAVDIVVSAPNYMDIGQNKGNGKREGTVADCRRLQERGMESWWYLSCMSHGCSEEDEADTTPDMTIERKSTYIRSIAWMQYKYKFNAFYYYNYVLAYSGVESGIDPWKNFYNFTGNGDGTLLYPGHAGKDGLTFEQPITSIRLKQWRETSFDAEYLNWFSKLQGKPVDISKKLDALISDPKTWEKNYKKYSEVREKIGAYLNKNME